MTQRPVIEDETVEEVNNAVQDVMVVDAEDVGLDKKIRVLLEDYQKKRSAFQRNR